MSTTIEWALRDRQKGSFEPHSLNRLSMIRQKVIFRCCWKLNRAIEKDCGNFFRMCLRLYRKITMKILNLNDLHWISHSLSYFHYRSLSCGNRRFELLYFLLFTLLVLYDMWLAFKMKWWREKLLKKIFE